MKTLLPASLLLLLFALPAAAGDAGRSWNVLLTDKDPRGTNVRASPAGKVIKVIPFESGSTPRQVRVSGQSGSWFKVEAGGVTGWMHGSMLGTCAAGTEDGSSRPGQEPSKRQPRRREDPGGRPRAPARYAWAMAARPLRGRQRRRT